jgi:hypothetical protein
VTATTFIVERTRYGATRLVTWRDGRRFVASPKEVAPKIK